MVGILRVTRTANRGMWVYDVKEYGVHHERLQETC